MSAVVVALLTLTAAGVPIAKAIDRTSRSIRLLGEGFLCGSGVAAISLYFVALSGLKWSLLVALIPLLTVSGISVVVINRRAEAALPFVESSQAKEWQRLAAASVDIVTAVFVTGYVRFATAAQPWEWDYWAIWGLKARVFFLRRGIDWAFLQDRWNSFAHPDYPPLLPMLYDFVALFGGEWNDRWFGLINVAYAIAILLIVRQVVREETGSSLVAALTTLAASGAALTTWVGIAEGVLIAYGAAAVLLIRRGLKSEGGDSLRQGAILLGFAALTKNEGVSLLVAVTIAGAVVSWPRWRSVIALWPAWALAASWQVVKTLRHLQTDLFEGAAATRAIDQVRGAVKVWRALAENPPDQPLFWIALIVALFFAGKRIVRHERFLMMALSLQILFYVAAYLVSPHDVFWHVANSWVRILGQVTLIATLLAAFALFGDRETV